MARAKTTEDRRVSGAIGKCNDLGPSFQDRTLDEQVAEAATVFIVNYEPESDGRMRAVIREFLKHDTALPLEHPSVVFRECKTCALSGMVRSRRRCGACIGGRRSCLRSRSRPRSPRTLLPRRPQGLASG